MYRTGDILARTISEVLLKLILALIVLVFNA